MNKLLIAALALGLSVLPVSAAPLFQLPSPGELPTARINGCALVLIPEGYTCTPDKFGRPIITPIGGEVADVTLPPCKFLTEKDCINQVFEPKKWWTDDPFKQLRTDLAGLGSN